MSGSSKSGSSEDNNSLTNQNFWPQWIFLYAAAFIFLAIPSICIWFSSDFTITAHEFDFFMGLVDFGDPDQIKNIFSPGKTVHFLLLSGIGFLFWTLTKRFYEDPSSMHIPFKAVAALSFLAILTLPYISPDVFFYLGTGWLEAHYHFSPFHHAMDEIPNAGNLPMFHNVVEVFRTGYSCYGPFFQKVAALFAYASLGFIRWGLILFKISNWLFHLVNCLLIMQIAKSLGLNEKRVGILFGLNPLILFSLIACAHNDIYLLFFFLVAIKCAYKNRSWMSMLALGVATDLKYIPLLVVPFFIFYLVRELSWPKKFLNSALYFLTFASIVALGHCLYSEGIDNAYRVVGGGVNVFRNNIFAVSMPLQEFFNFDIYTLKKALNFGYIFLYLSLLIRAAFGSWTISRLLKFSLAVLLIYLLTACEGLQEWYLCWLLPFGYLLENEVRYRYFVLEISTLFLPWVIYTLKAYSFITYFANFGLYFLTILISYETLLNPRMNNLVDNK